MDRIGLFHFLAAAKDKHGELESKDAGGHGKPASKTGHAGATDKPAHGTSAGKPKADAGHATHESDHAK